MAAKEHKERKEFLAERGCVQSTSRSMSDISSVVLTRTCCGWVCDHSRAPLDCGGRVQRRHRFSTGDRASKAAWRFASRRSPNKFSCSYVALYSLRFLAILGALILSSVFSYAEDLTTLDGKTFTNITEVTKYPKLVVFTYNSNRTSAAISNLPEDFLAKHGVEVPLHTAANANTQDASLQKDPLAMGQLLKAERDGDIETIKILLKNGADINSKQTPDGATALMWAAVEGHMDMVKLLLDNGADINATNNVGMTALMGAAFIGQTNEVELLLDKGADINAKQNDGKTALLFAASVGNIEVVKFLLAKGAEGGRAAVLQLQAWLDNASGKSVNAGVASDRPTLQSTNPVDIFLAQHSDSRLDVVKAITFNVTNVLEVVDHTCSIWVDAKGFNFGVLTDSAHSADKKTHDACFGFKYGEEKTAGQIFEKFIQWQKTAATNNVESFSKEIANVFVPHQTVLGSDSQCSFTFLWEKDSLYAGENARLQVSFYPEATGFSSGFLRVEDVLAFDKLLKSVPELKDELLQKIKNQEAQKNLFK